MLFSQIAFYVLAAVAVASALGVVLNRNAVYSMLSLIVNLLSLALFFLSLGGLFIATIQVLIYAGAVMVLFLFVVTMLTPGGQAQQGEDPLRWQWGAAVGMGVILIGALAWAGFSGAISHDAKTAGVSSLSHAMQAFGGNTEAFGMALFHGYAFPFEMTGLLLVAAALGAVALGRRPDSADTADE
ncbi:MAG TPA: NADH-quinone oxidoreductase subunit J [Ktedonobacterales bacterium]|nr:NADH-quinone oxidoreductase subunit J [Ktedonobacterales bacterium]HEX5572367.1 NADH-quinone oxidoreductase subunit J [Ktedonobacterales bacterium]